MVQFRDSARDIEHVESYHDSTSSKMVLFRPMGLPPQVLNDDDIRGQRKPQHDQHMCRNVRYTDIFDMHLLLHILVFVITKSSPAIGTDIRF